MIPQAFTPYIETGIIPRHEQFDKVRSLLYVRAIIEGSPILAELYLEMDERLAYTIAAYHDIGLCRDRAAHHLVSGEVMAEDANLLQWFGKKEIEIMREAVEGYRVSTDREPRSIYGKVVTGADCIIDPDTALRRTVQYGLKQDPAVDEAWHYRRFYDHLIEKYTPGGCLKL